MAPHIDFVAVIDTPLEIALARRLLRDTEPYIAGGALGQFSRWLRGEQGVTRVRGFLTSYLQGVRVLYQRMAAQTM
jgi:hypothetical protein